MKRFCLVLLFLLICAINHATHNRAGQLVFRHVPGTDYTYVLEHTQFYYEPSLAWCTRDALSIFFGDGNSDTIGIVSIEGGRLSLRQDCNNRRVRRLYQYNSDIPVDYVKAVYRMTYTFPGPGFYPIVVEDPNRNMGVANIPNSVNVYFSVTTVLRIDRSLGGVTAPIIERYPIDKAAVGQLFVHNPGAYHAGGDVLTYELVPCSRERGIELDEHSYFFPEASEDPFVIYIVSENDPESEFSAGDLVWNTPKEAGIYNVAIRIDQWHRIHRNVRVGSFVRDMQIEVVDTENKPPVFDAIEPVCVVAGDLVTVTVTATDPDNDLIDLTATGLPFTVLNSPADPLEIIEREPGKTVVTFTWQTLPEHVRNQSYTVTFKAEDQNPHVKLVAFATLNINVIASGVENLTATPEKREIRLEWDPSEFGNASGYAIYRRVCEQLCEDHEPCEPLVLEPCQTGIPSGFGYINIATIRNENLEVLNDKIIFRDNNISPGVPYNYRIVTIFDDDGAESVPSDEVSAFIDPGTPPIILADVTRVDDVFGEVHIEWIDEHFIAKLERDAEDYEYRLFHSIDPGVITDNNPDLWIEVETPAPLLIGGVNKVEHFPIDTKTENRYPIYYKVELWDKILDMPAIEANLNDFEIASTLYPILTPRDRTVVIDIGRHTPWINCNYYIYRCLADDNEFCIPEETEENFVIKITGENFRDSGLENDQRYCYLIVSEGYRYVDGVRYDIINRSHIACETPADNIPPCPPYDEELTRECDDGNFKLEWSFNHQLCDEYMEDDFAMFRIYFTPNPNETDYNRFELLEEIPRMDGQISYSFIHEGVTRGSYFITSVDYNGNESDKSQALILRDNCGSIRDGSYQIPNVFTPNDDNINDVLVAYIEGACLCRNDGTSECENIEGSAVTRVNMRIFNRVGKLVFETTEPCINWDGTDIDTGRKVSSGVYFYICDVYEMSDGREVLAEASPLSGIIHVFGEDANNRQAF